MESTLTLRAVRAVLGLLLIGAFSTAWSRELLTVETVEGWPPYLYTDQQGEPTGFGVELLQAVAKEEGLELRWKVEDWERSLVNLQQGNVDILPMMAFSEDRSERYGFSDNLMNSYDSIFVRRGESTITQLEDLNTLSVMVLRNSWLHEHLNKTGNYRGLVLADDAEQAMQRFADGEADCLLLSRLPGLVMIRHLAIDNVEALDLEMDWRSRHFVMAVSKNNKALLEILNRGLRKIRQNGVYNQLFDKWIASSDSALLAQRQSLQTLYVILGIALFVLILSGTFLWVMRRLIHEKTQALRAEVRERRKAEEAARVSEQKFRGALESSMQGMFISGLDGTMTDVNPSLCSMLGYTEREVVGTAFERLIHPEDTSTFELNLRLMRTGQIRQYQSEIRLVTNSGAYLWAHGFMSLASSTKGAPKEIVGQLQDITQHKADERRLAQQLYELNFLSATLDKFAIVARIDHCGRITDINAKGCLISGYDWEEILNKPVAEIFPEPGRRYQTASIWSTLKRNKAWHGELVRKNKDGQEVFLKTTIAPHQDDDGHQDYYLAVCTDITRQRSMEQEQEKLKSRLHQAEKMEAVGRLTGGIAHDFNNILASILGFTDLTLSKYGDELDEKAVRYLNEVSKAGDRARDLIAKMMTFSRSDASRPDTFDAAPVVIEALDMLKPTLPSSIEITLDVPESTNFLIWMDAVQMHQIVMNLLINARDALSGKGKINISLRHVDINYEYCASCHHRVSGHFIELSVKDNGEGIPAKTLKRVFDPFYTTKEVGSGTGMGLSVVHGIVHEHQGHILVSSSPHAGSEFRILFKPSEHMISSPVENTQPEPSSRPRANILVVDDEPLVGEYLKELFESVGHSVSLFDDSHIALKTFQCNPDRFDVVITDQTMPGLLGSELARSIRRLRQNLPIILCTGYVDNALEQDGLTHDFAVLQKPIKPRELLALIPNKRAEQQADLVLQK